jgi:hypothetical protein
MAIASPKFLIFSLKMGYSSHLSPSKNTKRKDETAWIPTPF